MTLAQIVENIRRRVPTYTAEEILAVCNDLVQACYEGIQATYIDPSTGSPPVFPTVAGQYQYDLPSDCRSLIGMLTESLPENLNTPADYGIMRFAQTEYYRINGLATDATEAGPGTFTFTYDPDTTTDKYLCYYNILTPTLTDVNADELPIPVSVHWQFRRGVLAMLNAEDYGESGSEEIVVRRTIRSVRNALNGGNSSVGRTNWQEQDRNVADSYSRSRGYYR